MKNTLNLLKLEGLALTIPFCMAAMVGMVVIERNAQLQ